MASVTGQDRTGDLAVHLFSVATEGRNQHRGADMANAEIRLASAWHEHLAFMLSKLDDQRLAEVSVRVQYLRGGQKPAPQLLAAA